PSFVAVLVVAAGTLSLAGKEIMRKDKLTEIDAAIGEAIKKAEIPGAVLWFESAGEVYLKAYGNRLVSPGSEVMTTDTLFDVASLTKVMATTPAILRLIEEGKISLDDPISKHLPEFLTGGVRPEVEDPMVTAEDRKSITIRHLITHQSGLPPGIFLSEADFWGRAEGVRRAATVGLIERPGSRFRYSDVNFILLGEIVRRVSGQGLDQYVQEHFYTPLGMTETGFLPDASSRSRIAPTTVIEGYGLLRGQVHDPTARRMEGVAGHAGLFSSAQDVATFVRLFLKKGIVEGNAVLEPESIKRATTNQLPVSLGVERGFGWDIGSSFASQRGEKFPKSGYGHTGWTGTSIWVDPASESFVILLANRNHPSEAGVIKALRTKVGTLAAEAVGYTELIPLSVNVTG
ncbi:MAG: serine hydrolase domain-containing protein, partial [Verrucomicrobiales bacterium]